MRLTAKEAAKILPEGALHSIEPKMSAKTKKAKSQLEETLMLHIRSSGIKIPKREYKFHETRQWRADFAWPTKKLLVECEGGVHGSPEKRGRHVRGRGFEEDCEKYNTAALEGWTVLRFTMTHIKSGIAAQMIGRYLREN